MITKSLMITQTLMKPLPAGSTMMPWCLARDGIKLFINKFFHLLQVSLLGITIDKPHPHRYARVAVAAGFFSFPPCFPDMLH